MIEGIVNRTCLRDATIEDCDLIYEWANDRTVRENSFSTDTIKYDEHVKWYRELLVSDNRRLYILEVDNQPVGQIRITIKNDEAEIGYSIASGYRGKGYGKLIVSFIPKTVRKDFPEVRTIIARVKTDNEASIKVFRNNGYEERFIVFECDIGY